MEGSTEKEHSWDKVNVICGRSCPVPIARRVVCDSPSEIKTQTRSDVVYQITFICGSKEKRELRKNE